MTGAPLASPHESLAQELAGRFAAFPQVEAVALGGSLALAAHDPRSDIDLYVFTLAEIPLPVREKLVTLRGARRADLDLRFWDPGDEWVDASTGIEVDVIYWDRAWIEGQIDRVLHEHRASLGYTTSFWHTVRRSRPLFDRQGWFAALQRRCQQPYPEALRQAVIAANHAVLRRIIPSYAHQIERAGQRGDLVSLNHRLAAFLASYFDVLFALNRQLHPGEKRLIAQAEACCPRLPVHMASDVEEALRRAAAADGRLAAQVHLLVDRLDALLVEEGFDPQRSAPFQR